MSYLSSIETPATQVSDIRDFSPLAVVSREQQRDALLDKFLKAGSLAPTDAAELMRLSLPSANDVLAELKTESRQQRPFRANPHE